MTGTIQAINNQTLLYVEGGHKFHFDKVEFRRGTKISEYPVMGSTINVAVEGAQPKQVTLTGRFLIKDFGSLTAYISSSVGHIISSFSINNLFFRDMVLVDAKTAYDNSKVYGQMVFTFKSTA